MKKNTVYVEYQLNKSAKVTEELIGQGKVRFISAFDPQRSESFIKGENFSAFSEPRKHQ